MLALLLPLSLTLSSPEEDIDLDHLPQAPKPCTIDWSGDYSDHADYIRFTEPRIHQNCSVLTEALNYSGPPESIHIDITGEFLKFRVRASITNDGKLVYDSEPSDVCECGSKELAALAMQQVAAAIKALQEPPPAVVPEDRPPEDDHPPPPPPPPPERKRPLLWTGIGLTVVGAGALSAGIPLHRYKSRSESIDLPGENIDRKSRALTLPLIIGGSVVLATGISLIIYDVVAAKKSKSKRTMVTPSASSSWAGLTISGKF